MKSKKNIDVEIVLNDRNIVKVFDLIQFAHQEYQMAVRQLEKPSIQKAFQKIGTLTPIIYSLKSLEDDLENIIKVSGLKGKNN